MGRYIEYDAIDYKHYKLIDKSEEFLNGVIYMATRIGEAPSIDIVFCRECKHRGICFGRLVQGTEVVQLNFCSHGERKESE